MTKREAVTHALRRTSPMGQKFVGTCFQCGTTGLTWKAVMEPCPNQRGLTQDDALIEAIEDASENAKVSHDQA